MPSAETWKSRVEEWRSGGQRAKEFCEPRGWSAKSLLWWSSELNRRQKVSGGKSKPVRLLPVAIRSRRAEQSTEPDIPLVFIEFEGARVFLPHGVDRGTLTDIFEALELRA